MISLRPGARRQGRLRLRAEAAWRRQPLSDYRITINVRSFWVGDCDVEGLVRHGEVVSATCTRSVLPGRLGPVTDRFLLSKLRLPELVLASWDSCATCRYDSVHGYPTVIVYDCPGSQDEEYTCRVLNVTPLAPGAEPDSARRADPSPSRSP